MNGIDQQIAARDRMQRASARLGVDDHALAQILGDHELIASEDARRYREMCAIVASSGDAIIGETLEGIVTTWNRGAERLFGYASHEITGRSVSLLLPPDRQDEETQLLTRLLHGEPIQVETVRRHKDGHDIQIAVTISPINDASGTVIGASKFARDITAQRGFEAALRQARDEAEAANRELETFSYSVAHDLRAPLRGINGFANVLLEDYGAVLDPAGHEWLELIRTSAATMGSLIDSLLSLSRMARTPVRRERTDLSALVRAAATTLADTEPERRVEIVVPDRLETLADGRLARVLIDNLLGNAWKFTAHVAKPRIELGSFERDGATIYFVRDNGAGFDMAHATRLFGPFQRMHTVHEFPGTGIGLATVQRIVLRHGGKIWAEARVGEGATFFFTLPGAA